MQRRSYLALWFVLGCASSSPPPSAPAELPENRAAELPAQRPGNAQREAVTPGTESDRDAIAFALVALEELAKASMGAAGNCGALAQLIGGRIEANSELWQHLGEMSRDPEREKMLIAAESDVSARMEQFADALGACAFDPRVRMSLERMTFAN